MLDACRSDDRFTVCRSSFQDSCVAHQLSIEAHLLCRREISRLRPGASFVPFLSHGSVAQSERSRIPRHVVQNGNLINNKIHRSVEEQRRRRRSKDEIPSSPPSDYTDMSRFFVFYVGVKVIVLPGHWPSLSLSLLSAKWIFRNVICCAARSETFLR